MSDKPIQNQKNFLDPSGLLKKFKKAGVRHGIAGQEIDEAAPTYEKAPSEKIIGGVNNSYVIFGRDRPTVRLSGYGGKGGTQCSKIDLVAGLGSSMTPDGPPDEDVMISPNFVRDAARVYISQRADIDAYMGLAEAPRDKSKARSAIALKADCVRIHGRNNIKIVTGKGKFPGLGKNGEPNSSGGHDEIPGTISLIAGNHTGFESKGSFNFFNFKNKVLEERKKLQGITKGDNLIEFINDFMKYTDGMLNLIQQNAMLINELALSYQNHFHIIPTPVPVPVPRVRFNKQQVRLFILPWQL